MLPTLLSWLGLIMAVGVSGYVASQIHKVSTSNPKTRLGLIGQGVLTFFFFLGWFWLAYHLL